MSETYQPTDEEMEEMAEWIATRPPALIALMDSFPPASYVKAKEGKVLFVPPPGVVGQISGYSEEVTDDGSTTFFITVQVGPMTGECDPIWLEVVDSDHQLALYKLAKAMRCPG